MGVVGLGRSSVGERVELRLSLRRDHCKEKTTLFDVWTAVHLSESCSFYVTV